MFVECDIAIFGRALGGLGAVEYLSILDDIKVEERWNGGRSH